MFKEKLKGFIAGVCTTVLLTGAVTAFAANIDVIMGGIKVYWDGVEKTLTDVDGKKVEPMIHNGSTYVPIRAMANLMGKEVDWDQQNMAVIVGEKPVAESTSILEMNEKINKNDGISMKTGKEATFKLKDKEIQCENLVVAQRHSTSRTLTHYGEIMYVLDGDYSELTGKIVFPYEEVGSSSEGYISFYDVKNNGDEELIENYDIKQTQETIDIKINLRGVENLKIEMHGKHRSDYSPAFYNVYFLSE